MADITASTPKPTGIRFVVVGLTTLMAVLLYLDRLCLSFFAQYIREDLGLSDLQVGILLSAFFWTYALFQVPSGFLTDRFGARLMLTVYILAWSLFTGLAGLAYSFIVLLLLRFGFGFGQAGAYPTGASIVSKWVPFSGRGTASSIVAAGGRAGGFLAPILTAYLLVLLVPVSVDSKLTQRDIMKPRSFAESLKNPVDAEKAFEKLAAAIVKLLPDQPKALVAASDDDLQVKLASAFNQIMQQHDLYRLALSDDISIYSLNLPQEATHLASLPSDELTEQQKLRLNRLILEVAFPDYIRKIYSEGWRPAVIIYGLAGLVIAGLFWFFVRNRPPDHPTCNEAEVALIEYGRPTTTNPHGRVGALPIKYLVGNVSLWCSAASQFLTNFGWVFLALQLPHYLADAHNVAPIERGWMASLPLGIGIVGMLSGGTLTDRLTRRLGLKWGRRFPMAMTRFMAMTAYLSCLFLDNPWLLTAAFCVVAISTDLGTASIWAFKQDVGGRYVGSVLGWGNMWGNLGAAVSPIMLVLVREAGSWQTVFLYCAGAFCLAGLAALGVDATSPVVPDQAAAHS